MRGKRPESSKADALLAERESRVLVWSLLARMVFLAIIGGLLLLYLAGAIPAGIIAQTPGDAWPTLVVVFVGATLAGALHWILRSNDRYAHAVGTGAVLIDTAILAVLPWVWLHTVPELSAAPSGLVKGELYGVALLLIVINSVTLCPDYPAFMTVGAVAVLGGVAYLTLGGPEVTFTSSYAEHFQTTAVNPGILVIRFLILVLCGAFLSLLAYTARHTIIRAIDLEISNLELLERQTEMAFEGRMAALDGMVAGIAHELNTPLGAVRSSIDTTEASLARLAPNADDPQTQRTLQLVRDVSGAARQGLNRIDGLVDSLRDFSRLDEAETQLADLRVELDNVLALIDKDLVGAVQIEKHYGEIPQVECQPRELNQAFMTILVNAFEAMNGRGSLSVNVARSNGNVQVTLSDTGPGIPPDLRPHLFELNLGRKGQRVGMGLGLPTSRRIVERHGGTLTLEETPGPGAAFRISLPTRVRS